MLGKLFDAVIFAGCLVLLVGIVAIEYEILRITLGGLAANYTYLKESGYYDRLHKYREEKLAKELAQKAQETVEEIIQEPKKKMF